MALTIYGASADSYTSLADADTYVASYFSNADLTVWQAASTEAKESALRQATQYIDSKFGDRFPGQIVSTSQSLAWPRVNASDRAGRVITDIPDACRNATVELAGRRVVSGGSLAPAQSRGLKSAKVGPIEVKYTAAAASGAPETNYQWVNQLLSAVLITAGRRIVRV